MKPAARQSGNLMIDLIVGILLLAIISISAGGVLSNLFQRSADAYERVQSTWLANSVMEYYSGKEFANIEADNINDEKFTPDTRLVANVTVDWVTIDGDNIVASAEETSFKKIIVTANNNVSDNSVTLKTIINDGGE
jgi:type II secretory pathway pseudopilin PulG